MIGITIVLIAVLVEELSSSIGKRSIHEHRESFYALGFLGMLCGTLFFIGSIIFDPGRFVFTRESLPTFSLRLFLELLQAQISLMALVRADRSTFSFLRVATIPLLLFIDLLLGYDLVLGQALGIGMIVAALIVVFLGHGIQKAGSGLVIFSAINAVITTSLYKYDISYFNSVAAEQGIILLILTAYFFVMEWRRSGENPFKMLFQKLLFAQSMLRGVGVVSMSFAMTLAPASIIITAERVFGVMWAIAAGSIIFHERHLFVKLTIFVMLSVGLFLLSFPPQI